MKKCLVILACLFMLANCVYAKDSAGTSPNLLSGNPDLEMYGKDITGVNRVILTGTPQSSSDAVPKGYVDSQISAIESMVKALKKSVEAQNKVINRMVGQQQILNQSINNMNNSVSNQINSLQIRVSRLENTPPPSPPSPKCPTTAWYSYSYSLGQLDKKIACYKRVWTGSGYGNPVHRPGRSAGSCWYLAKNKDPLNCTYYSLRYHKRDSK